MLEAALERERQALAQANLRAQQTDGGEIQE